VAGRLSGASAPPAPGDEQVHRNAPVTPALMLAQGVACGRASAMA
jgi:hypothetical protein